MFGQLVVGPPGSGKSTYCAAMQQYCTGIKRDVAIVNLDPANEKLPYECAIDIRELIQLQEVMESFELGPNGGLIYAMEYLVKNLAWLKSQLDALRGKYLVFDFPGQVELFTQHDACKVLASTLINKWNYRMCTVQLIDAHHCSDASKYISCVTMSLSCMLHLETPHVSFLSKADLVEQYGALSFGLEYYTNGRNLKSLLSGLGDERDPFVARHKKLSEKIIQVVEEFCLVSFSPLSVIEKDSMTVCFMAQIRTPPSPFPHAVELLYDPKRSGATPNRTLSSILTRRLDTSRCQRSGIGGSKHWHERHLRM